MLSTRLFVVKSKHFSDVVFKPIQNSYCSVLPVVTLRLQFFFLSSFDFHLFSIRSTNNYTLSRSPIFKWTRTGFSMLLGFHYVRAASEKLIKLLINRFCVKHKYELRRVFSRCCASQYQQIRKERKSVLLFCRFS